MKKVFLAVVCGLLAQLAIAHSPANAFDGGGTIDPPASEPVDDIRREFPRTLDDLPTDFVFLSVSGPEDRSGVFDTVYAPTEADSPRVSGFRGELPSLVTSGVITAGTCKYRQKTDSIHRTTNTNGSLAVSVHGWWTKESTSGACPSKANVDIYLYAYGCGSFTGCGWVLVGSGSKDVFQGGGSANRANARRTCANTQTVAYKEQVDVDLINWSDPSGYSQGPETQVACYPT